MEAAYIRNNQRCLNMEAVCIWKATYIRNNQRCLNMEAAYI